MAKEQKSYLSVKSNDDNKKKKIRDSIVYISCLAKLIPLFLLWS